jgi:RHS repeat-associated protein
VKNLRVAERSTTLFFPDILRNLLSTPVQDPVKTLSLPFSSLNQYYEKTGTTVTTSYYLGGNADVAQVRAQRKGTVLSYFHQDHLGSTSKTTNPGGGQESSINYYAFGLTRSWSGTLPKDRLFTGQRKVDGSATDGLYYYNARYYDAVIGRFISPDSIIPDPANPQTLNRYSYCLNNPLKYVDPSGHLPDPPPGVDAYMWYMSQAGNGGGNGNGNPPPDLPLWKQGELAQQALNKFPFRIPTMDATLDSIQGYLNGLGFVPVFGEGFDFVNAMISFYRGDYMGAGLSAGAIIPGLGWIFGGARWASKADNGFDTFRQLKNSIGDPGEGKEWHHIVEQCQTTKSGFDPKLIQNPDNVLAVDAATHAKISGYYNSIQEFSEGKRVRNWLTGQPLSTQYEFGIKALRKFGD